VPKVSTSDGKIHEVDVIVLAVGFDAAPALSAVSTSAAATAVR